MPRPVVMDLIARDSFTLTFLRAGAATRALADETVAASRRMTAAGATGGAGLAAGVAAGVKVAAASAAVFGVVAVDFAAKFDRAMELVHTQAGATQAEVDKLKDKVLTLGAETAQSPIKLADALFHVESVGFRGADAMNVLGQAAKLATISTADVGDVTYGLVSIMNAYGAKANEAAKYASFFNAVVGSGDIKMQAFSESIGSGFFSAAQSFGVSLESAGAALVFLTDRGQSASEASTRLRMSMALMGAPTQRATALLTALGMAGPEVKASTDAMTEALQKAHLTTTTLSADMKKPNGLFVALSDLKQHLIDSGISAEAAAALMTRAFGGGKSNAGILAMIQNLDGGPSSLRAKFDQIGKSMGNFGQAWADTQKQFSVKVDKAKASLEAFAIRAGNVLLPIVSGVFDFMAKHAQALAIVIGVTLVGALTAYVAKLTWAAIMTIASMVKMTAAVVVNSVAYIAALTGMSVAWTRMGSSAETAAIRGLGARSAISGVFSSIGALVGPAVVGLALVGAAVYQATRGWTSQQVTLQANKKLVEGLTQALQADSGALGTNTQAQVANDLEKSGALKTAQTLGINLAQLTKGLLGNADAANAVGDQLRALSKAHPELRGKITDLIVALDIEGKSLGAAEAGQKRVAAATEGSTTAFADSITHTRAAAIAGDRYNIATRGATDAAKLQKDALGLLNGALLTLNGTVLTNMQSEDSFHSSLNNIATQIKNNNTPTLIGFSDAAISNRAVIYSASQAILDHADKMLKDGQTAQTVKKYILDHKDSLEKAATAAGEDAGQVYNLTNKLLGIPKKVQSKIDADTSAANRKIADTKATLDFMAAHPYAVQVTATGDVLFHSPTGGTAGRDAAEGGVLPGWSPGKDNLTFYNPKVGFLHLSGGEGILRPEAVRAMGGAPAINSLNKAAKSGHFQASLSPAKSGRLRFADGGIIHLNVNFDIPQAIKDAVKAGPVSSVGPAGGPATVGGSLGAWINAALAITGSPASWFGPTLRRIMFESGGNPSAINLWDSNAQAGYPSQGLMQTIPQTFNAYHVAGTSNNITDPVANIAAALEYIKSRYGGYGPIDPPVQGYRRGAWDIARNQLGYLHRGEMVIPAEDATQIRAGRGSSGKTVNVYQTINPQAKQSELEIGAIAAARIGWASQVA